MLSDQEQLRYSRQLLLSGFDHNQQLMLKRATVLIVGAGGLGTPACLYLAASGVGKLIIADGDKVELSNLQRQVAYTINDLNQNKADTIAKHLQHLNDDIDIETIDEMVDQESLDCYLPEVDLILDCSDNLTTRYLLNQKCIEYDTPLISGAAIRFEGQLMVIDPRQESYSCYQCFYPKTKGEPSLNCSTAGVMGPILGVIGSMQALQAIKVLTGEKINTNQVVLFDGKSMQWQHFSIAKKTNCVCQ